MSKNGKGMQGVTPRLTISDEMFHFYVGQFHANADGLTNITMQTADALREQMESLRGALGAQLDRRMIYGDEFELAADVATSYSDAVSVSVNIEDPEKRYRVYGVPTKISGSAVELGEVYFNGRHLMLRHDTLDLIAIYGDEFAEDLAHRIHGLRAGASLRLDSEVNLLVGVLVSAKERGDWARVSGASQALRERREAAVAALEELDSAIEVAKAALGESLG